MHKHDLLLIALGAVAVAAVLCGCPVTETPETGDSLECWEMQAYLNYNATLAQAEFELYLGLGGSIETDEYAELSRNAEQTALLRDNFQCQTDDEGGGKP